MVAIMEEPMMYTKTEFYIKRAYKLLEEARVLYDYEMLKELANKIREDDEDHQVPGNVDYVVE